MVAIDNEGQRAMREFTVIPMPPAESASIPSPVTPPSPPAPAVPKSAINFGRYHALIIGINAYTHLPRLQTAINDATSIAEILQTITAFLAEWL
jgi:hypothetical protein